MPEDYDAFRAMLVDKPVVFYASLARLFGGINEALFFQQIAYWSGRGADPEWIYKTREELELETCLSRYQQEQARKTLVKLGVLEETKRGLPAKLYYRVVWGRLYELYGAAVKDARNSHPRMRESDRQASEELTSRPARNSPAITETTTEKNPERSFEDSKDLPTDFDDERDVIGNYIADFAREFADQAPLASSVSRAVNLYRQSNASMDGFIAAMYAARAITKERSASVRGKANEHGTKQRMAYWFSVLERELERETA